MSCWQWVNNVILLCEISHKLLGLWNWKSQSAYKAPQFQYVKLLNKELSNFDHSSYQRIVAPILLLKKSCRPGKPQGYANSYKPGLFPTFIFKPPGHLPTSRTKRLRQADSNHHQKSWKHWQYLHGLKEMNSSYSITMSSWQSFTQCQFMLGIHAIWVQTQSTI